MTGDNGFIGSDNARGLSRRAFLRRSGLLGVGAVGAGTLGSGLLAACGSTSGSSGSGSGLSVYNWGNADEGKLYDQTLNAFSKSHGGIAVQDSVVPVTLWGDYVDKLVIQVADGKSPDLINIAMEGTRLAASKSLLSPLGPYLGTGGVQSLLARMPPVLKTAFTVGGKLYGVPNGWQTMAIYYNTKIFAEHHIAPPDPDWTWDDFLQIAQRLTTGGVMGFGLPWGFFQLHPWWLTNGGYPVTADYTKPNLTDPAVVEAVTFVHDLVRVHKVSPDTTSVDVYAGFAAGKYAMIGAGNWPLAGWVQAGFTDYAAVPWPKKKSHTTVVGGAAWGISPHASNPSLAWQALEALIQPPVLSKVAVVGQEIPPYAHTAGSLGDTTADTAQKFLGTLLPDSRAVAAPAFYDQLESVAMRYLTEIVDGQVTPATGLRQAQNELENGIS
jgi:multiple sugar transport system substrate-binding protein